MEDKEVALFFCFQEEENDYAMVQGILFRKNRRINTSGSR